ncbi:hypothetical protein ACHAQH_005382 [Verticillium albo-atrum]
MADEQASSTAATTMTTPSATQSQHTQAQPLPRIAIQFCTQCKWMLRAAYFAQELLSTFSTSLGEVALIPSTGGTFTVTITTPADAKPGEVTTTTTTTSTRTLWDRKMDGGFPETKELKRRVRDVIDPGRDLGHVDRNHARPAATAATTVAASTMPASSSTGAANEVPAQGGSSLDDQARDRIASARTNKGQTAPSGVDGASLVGELKGHGSGSAPAPTQTPAPHGGPLGEVKAACEDCT